MPEDAPHALLDTFFERSFLDDPEAQAKRTLLAELMGVTALGWGTRLTDPKAVILYGPMAWNGKSQMLICFGD